MRLHQLTRTYAELAISPHEQIAFSHGTPVAEVSLSGIRLSPQWDCSRTTTKHTAKFLGLTPREIRSKISDGSYEIRHLLYERSPA